MRRAAKTDRNQTPLVKAYRQLGVSVQHLHTVGGGCADLLLGFGYPGDGWGLNILQELKYGPANWSAEKRRSELTGDEPKWHDNWCGQVEIVSCTEDEVAGVAAERVAYWREIADLLWELTRVTEA